MGEEASSSCGVSNTRSSVSNASRPSKQINGRGACRCGGSPLWARKLLPLVGCLTLGSGVSNTRSSVLNSRSSVLNTRSSVSNTRYNVSNTRSSVSNASRPSKQINGRGACRGRGSPPQGLSPTLHTLQPTPYTLHPTPYTLHPTPYTLHPSPFTLHPTPYTPHPTP